MASMGEFGGKDAMQASVIGSTEHASFDRKGRPGGRISQGHCADAMLASAPEPAAPAHFSTGTNAILTLRIAVERLGRGT